MNKKNIFIGFDKKYNRCLLYKDNKGDYIDLETAQKYKSDNLIIGSLVSYNQLVQFSGINTKRNIRKKYQKSENKPISLEKVFVGDIYKVTDIKNIKESNQTLDITPYMKAISLYFGVPYIFGEFSIPEYVIYNYKGKKLYSDRLLKEDDNSIFYKYEDVITGQKYKDRNCIHNVGDLVIENPEYFVKTIDADIIDSEISRKELIKLFIEDRTKKCNIKIKK